jgi:nitrile hydratase
MHEFLEAVVDGVHDLGGMHGFGPVVRELNEPTFHAPWEATVVAMMRSARAHGVFNIDEFRHAIERMPPGEYLTATYYERWLDAVSRLAVEKGLTTEQELERRAGAVGANDKLPGLATQVSDREAVGPDRAMTDPGMTKPSVTTASSSFRPATSKPRYKVGDPVVTIETHTKGHTRLPRYARGKHGVVHAYHGFHVFPDASAHGRGESPQPLYSVRFESDELWGPSGELSQAVYLDLWESYLQPDAA